MKKFLILAALLLVSCQAESVQEPVAEVETTETSWNAVTFNTTADWTMDSVNAESIVWRNAEGQIQFEIVDDYETSEFENMNLSDQNYKIFSQEPVEIGTSIAKQDILVSSELDFETVWSFLENIERTQIEWMGYTLDTPAGLDWFSGETYDTTWDLILFMEDDGNFLENEGKHPCLNPETNKIEGCDYSAPINVNFVTDGTKLSEINKNPEFYDEVDFNGVVYEVVKFTSMLDGNTHVTYKGKVGDKYLQVNAVEDYEEAAETIFNEIIGL